MQDDIFHISQSIIHETKMSSLIEIIYTELFFHENVSQFRLTFNLINIKSLLPSMFVTRDYNNIHFVSIVSHLLESYY